MHKVKTYLVSLSSRESYCTTSVVDGMLLYFSRGNRDLLRGAFMHVFVVSGAYSGDESIVGVDARWS
jgi:hypothetical protein